METIEQEYINLNRDCLNLSRRGELMETALAMSQMWIVQSLNLSRRGELMETSVIRGRRSACTNLNLPRKDEVRYHK